MAVPRAQSLVTNLFVADVSWACLLTCTHFGRIRVPCISIGSVYISIHESLAVYYSPVQILPSAACCPAVTARNWV